MRSVLPIFALAALTIPCAVSAADLAAYPGHSRRVAYVADPPAVGGPVVGRPRFVRVRHLHATSGQAFARLGGQLVLIDTETRPMRIIDIIR